jgi:hypothetical protein
MILLSKSYIVPASIGFISIKLSVFLVDDYIRVGLDHSCFCGWDGTIPVSVWFERYEVDGWSVFIAF